MMKYTFNRDGVSWKILFITLPTMSTKLSFPVIQLSKLENYQQIVSGREEAWAQIVTDKRDASSFTPAFWIIFHLLQNFRFVSFDSIFSWICFQKVWSSSLERCSRSIFHPRDLLASWSRMVTFQMPPALCLLLKVDLYPLPKNNVWLLPNERKQVALER